MSTIVADYVIIMDSKITRKIKEKKSKRRKTSKDGCQYCKLSYASHLSRHKIRWGCDKKPDEPCPHEKRLNKKTHKEIKMKDELPKLHGDSRKSWRRNSILNRRAIEAEKNRKSIRWHQKKPDGTPDKEEINEAVIKIGCSNRLLGRPSTEGDPISNPDHFKKI